LYGDVAGVTLDLVGRSQRPVPIAHLLLGLMREWAVDEAQQRVVLPEAEAEGDREDGQGHEQAGAKLVEMIHDAQLLVVADAPHRSAQDP
jgi:hypothetical protein